MRTRGGLRGWVVAASRTRAIAVFLFWTVLAPGHASAAVDAQEQVRVASERVLSALDSEGRGLTQNPERLYALVDAVLLQHMDFDRMSRWVLGKNWKTASGEQQARFVSEFRRLLVRTYATALANYGGQTVRYLPPREGRNPDEVTVRTEIQQPAGPPVAVNYSLYLLDGDWKAYDVQIDGISLIANYRASFSAEARAIGLEGLIRSLAIRNQQALNDQ